MLSGQLDSPRWGDHSPVQVKSVAVEAWLKSIPRARGTKAKIRNIMSAVFTHAMRYEWVDKNPIKLVRQSAKRERIPDVLELAEIQLLLSKLRSGNGRWCCWMRAQGFASASFWRCAGRMWISRALS